MRKNIYIAVLGCLAIWLMGACMDDKIPATSKAFIDQYFPESSVVLVEMDTDDDGGKEYSVCLNDGTKIEFDMQGDWKRVGRKKTGVPSTLVPPPIWEYAKTHYPEDVITKLSKKPYGYKIELSNDEDMRFTPQGQFIEKID
jgi:hypothetical protein